MGCCHCNRRDIPLIVNQHIPANPPPIQRRVVKELSNRIARAWIILACKATRLAFRRKLWSFLGAHLNYIKQRGQGKLQ